MRSRLRSEDWRRATALSSETLPSLEGRLSGFGHARFLAWAAPTPDVRVGAATTRWGARGASRVSRPLPSARSDASAPNALLRADAGRHRAPCAQFACSGTHEPSTRTPRQSSSPCARDAHRRGLVSGSPLPPTVAASAGGSAVTALEEAVERPPTPEDVAALLRVDRETVYRMARRGELPGFKVSSRWRFRLRSCSAGWNSRKARTSRLAGRSRPFASTVGLLGACVARTWGKPRALSCRGPCRCPRPRLDPRHRSRTAANRRPEDATGCWRRSSSSSSTRCTAASPLGRDAETPRVRQPPDKLDLALSVGNHVASAHG
jgi:excisionase family DNA binding protein